jgi:serine phosphatase RsbU (regulator of sigma subunit)
MHRGIRSRHSSRSGNRSGEFVRPLSPSMAEEHSVAAQARVLENEVRSLRQDISEAAHLQHLLNGPRELRRGHFEIACETFPVNLISGDFCTIFDVGNKTVIALGDIAGKGLTAGMWFTHIISLVRFHAASTADPAAAMFAINNELCSLRLERPLITVFLASLDSTDNTLTYCRAGHPPPIVVRAHSGPALAHEGGPILGVIHNAAFDMGATTFRPGDGLLAYSDGVSEIRNERGEDFGIRRLLDEAERCERSSAAKFLFCLLGAVKDFAGGAAPDDDITMMALLKNS